MRRVIENYKEDALATFSNYKRLAEMAMDQISDQEFFEIVDPESNSIGIIIKHISGNQRSRFTDFLTTDGEKPDRDRDREFELEESSRQQLMEDWETGWKKVDESVRKLTVEDFTKTITIRGESHTIMEAINRQMTHYAYHIGQIVFAAKHFRSKSWQSLSVPKNMSQEFNEYLSDKASKAADKKHPLEGPMEFSRIYGDKRE